MLGNVLLAIILAVLVWVVAERQANPSSEKTFRDPIPIALQNLPAGMVTYDDSADEVQVTVSTPDNVWNEIDPEQVTAWIDLSGQVSGTLDLPVNVYRSRSRCAGRQDRAGLRAPEDGTAGRSATAGSRSTSAASRRWGLPSSPIETTPATVTVRGPASFVRTMAAASRAVVDSGCAQYHLANDCPDRRAIETGRPCRTCRSIPAPRWPWCACSRWAASAIWP